MKTTTILIILTIIYLSTHGIQATNQTCSYSIQIETTCAPSADTTDRIGVRFSDSSGNLVIVKQLKHPKLLYAPKPAKIGSGGGDGGGGVYGGFKRCAVDMFEASGACMNQKVCSLYLKRFGSDGWRPGWVKVLQQREGGYQVEISYVFYFRTFVPENVWFGFDYCHSRGGFIPRVASFGGD